MENKHKRETIVNEAKRQHILDAAKKLFMEKGIEGASLRNIAHSAGYSPAALYTYFQSKEEIYACLLDISLDKLKDYILNFTFSESEVESSLLKEKAYAFFNYYLENPQDMDLGFYLFNGAQPRGLNPILDKKLNNKLISTLLPIQVALIKMGYHKKEAITETAAIFAYCFGLLLIHNTGRIKIFNQNTLDLFHLFMDRYKVK